MYTFALPSFVREKEVVGVGSCNSTNTLRAHTSSLTFVTQTKPPVHDHSPKQTDNNLQPSDTAEAFDCNITRGITGDGKADLEGSPTQSAPITH